MATKWRPAKTKSFKKRLHEQERNFDNSKGAYEDVPETPFLHERGYTVIDGKTYKIFS